ncbi:MAG: hypothetical protein HZB24_14250 [Desulfobacterales bacterium]|nr:hypothetical protein [Desulfobacterales bacterium]
MSQRSTSLIFAPSEAIIASRIADLICRDVGLPADCCPVCTSEEMLRGALKNVPHHRCLAVLLAARPDELDRMVALSAWLQDLPIILMIPAGDSETIAKAHRLRPRYLMGPQVDYAELRAVIENIFWRKAARVPSEPQSSPAMLVSLKGKADRFFRIPNSNN